MNNDFEMQSSLSQSNIYSVCLGKMGAGFLDFTLMSDFCKCGKRKSFHFNREYKKKGDESKDLSSLAIKRHQRDFGEPVDMFCVAGNRYCFSKHLYT